MNAQEIFDTVASHLAKQGHRALATCAYRSPTCAYRSPNGDKCAFGILIPDEYYCPDMEGRYSRVLIDEFEGLEKFRPYECLIRDLQRLHDVADQHQSFCIGSSSQHPNLKGRLSLLASTYKLSPAILDTLTFPEVWK